MKAVIYTKTTCPWCVKAKDLLKLKNVEIEEHVLGENNVTKDTIQNKVPAGYKVSTVPQIFLNGKHIGGYTDLAKHFGV